MTSQSTALSFTGHDSPGVPRCLHTSTLQLLLGCVRAVTSPRAQGVWSSSQRQGQGPHHHPSSSQPLGPSVFYIQQFSATSLHFNNPLHADNTKYKKAPLSEKPMPALPRDLPLHRVKAPCQPKPRYRHLLTAGIPTHMLLAARASPYHDVVTLHLRLLTG